MSVMNDLATPLLETVKAVTGFGMHAEDFDALSDAQVIDLQRAIAECDRRLGVYKSHAARQLSRRSRHELGHAGLAARNGFSSPEAMIQSVTKVTSREAYRLAAIGRIMDQAGAVQQLLADGISEIGGEPIVVPWETPITQAIEAGVFSVDCADAIRRGLGSPTEHVTTDILRSLAEQVIADHGALSVDKLFIAARSERDLIDLEGVRARQQELYERGGLRLFPRPDGMWKLTADLDPEAAAELTSALDPLTSPRRGGPRFTDAADQARAQRIIDDPRTTERLALDGLLELVRLGVNADPSTMYGTIRPVVKIVITREILETGTGFALIENNAHPVTAQTAERTLCNGDSIELTMSPDGAPLDLGRTRRLFSGRQREALAVRDGGCLWPECEKPPSWTEAHHVEHWHRDQGKTNVDAGILLCKYHHLQLHNNRWEIERRGNQYWLVPPPIIDPEQEPIELHSKSLLMEQLRRRAAG
jgi:hypothetical protein